MQPPARRPPDPWQIERTRIRKLERRLFFQNLDLIIAHEADILRCDEYFFCRPAFAGHYLMYLSGHINVGTLLLGWRTGILLDECRSKLGVRKSYYSCIGTAHVYHFGGRGSGMSWSGFCRTCGGYAGRNIAETFRDRRAFVKFCKHPVSRLV